MGLSVLSSLAEIEPESWNALVGASNPFLCHEFLSALERHHCVGPKTGWVPKHLVLQQSGRLLGAVPMYLKNNSYGEFVFDWAWAEAYQRAGLHYYPKLVVAIPYTPVTGPRLLLADMPEREDSADRLILGALELAHTLKVSSLHWLFTSAEDTERLERHGLMRRAGCQFHWQNRGYQDFDDFLASLSAEKRKKVKRERRRVREAEVTLEVLTGHQISAHQWERFHYFYTLTFLRRGGVASLTLDFFKEIGRTIPDKILLILAKYKGEYVAGAFNLRGSTTLYGRHWGCTEQFHSLHFEVCYYRAIEYCIEQGLQGFEAGAQGEHKISRGFLPTQTWSAHWLSHPAFSNAVQDFLTQEQQHMQYYMDELGEHSPFKRCQEHE